MQEAESIQASTYGEEKLAETFLDQLRVRFA